LYESLVLVVLVSAVALAQSGRLGLVALTVLVAFNLGTYVRRAPGYEANIAEAMKMYDQAPRADLGPAIVFLNLVAPYFEAQDATRNDLLVDGPVLFARDLGARNAELLKKYPDRKAYTYVYDPNARSGRFVPWSGESKSPAPDHP
jgi:hypothetical protein